MPTSHPRPFVRTLRRPLALFLVFTLLFTLLPAARSHAGTVSEPDLTSSSPDSWSSAASMSMPRLEQTAILLSNGKVLVAGGISGTVIYSSTEIYDPIADTWSFAAPMSIPRFRHTAILLPHGKVLVVGGVDDHGATLASAEIYDLLTNTWVPAASMSVPRAYAHSILLENGNVLVIGGYNDSGSNIGTAELYHPETNTWSTTTSMQSIRGSVTATLLGDGRVLAVGGPDSSNVMTSTAELYDPAANKWSSASNMTTPRYGIAATLLGNGKVLVVGGTGPIDNATSPLTSTELYDPALNTWTPTGGMAIGRELPTLTPLGNGKVLVAGGYPHGSPFDHYFIATAEIYDPATGSWSPAPNMNSPRGGHTATLLGNGKVLVVGGSFHGSTCCPYGGLRSAEIYTPACSTKAGAACDTTLSLTVQGPDALTVTDGQYTPNPFQITGTVRNDGAAVAKDVRVTLYLPHGLDLAGGSVTQNVGDLVAGEERHLSWSVRGTGISEDATLHYFLAASASNAVALPAGSQIAIPRLLTIAAVTPNKGGNAGSVTVNVRGSGFKDGAVVKLGGIIGQHTAVLSSEQITTTLDLRNQSPGTAMLEVVNPDSASTAAPEPFTIVSGGEGRVLLDLVAPGFVRVGTHESLTNVPFYLIVRNDASVDREKVLISVDALADPIISSAMGHPQREKLQSFASFSIGVSFNSSTNIQISNVPGGSSIALGGAATGTTARCISLSVGDPCGIARWNAIIASLKVNQDINNLSKLYASYTKNNCTNHPTTRDCATMYQDMLRAFGELGADLQDLYQALKDLAECETKHGLTSTLPSPPPPLTLPSPTGPLPSLPPAISPPSSPPSSRTTTTCSVGSADPNDIYGPAGSGDARYVRGDSPLSYNVVFENKPDATAAAQEVVVTDSLDLAKIDPGTFSLGPIAFGATQITPPPGLKQFATDLDLRPANNLIVRVNAGLDETTGLITWRFVSLDPATGLPTTDVLAGFLPPNKTSPEGEGSVFYTVSPKPSLATGTEIRTKATIVFDANPSIDTPEWRNTIDNTQPTSQIHPLTAKQSFASFNVAWSGTDVGAGVQDYSVYASEDGGPYIPWLIDTAATSAIFPGTPGKSYAFYSVARDQVGNMEEPPVAADATTKIPYLIYLPIMRK